MRHLILAIFFAIAFLAGKAQDYPPALTKKFTINRGLTSEYFVFDKDGKHGVVNKAGAIILPAIYGGIYNTRFDWFIVRIGEWDKGIVNAKNTTIIPFDFEDIDIISRQRIHVHKKGLSFLLSPSNQFLSDTSERPTTYYQVNDQMLSSPAFTPASIMADHDYAANDFIRINKDILIIKGNDTINTGYQDIGPLVNDGSLIKFKKNDHWGIVDNKNTELIPPAYDDIDEDERTGLIKLYKEKKISLLDTHLKPVPAGPFDRMGYFNNYGIATIGVGDKEGLINSSGKILFQPADVRIRPFGDRFFDITYNKDDKIIIIDNEMKNILPAGTSVRAYEGNILLLVTADKKMGAYHTAGYTLLPAVYDEVFFGNTDEEDTHFFKVRKGMKWGIVDFQGKEVVPYSYDKISLFSNGYAPAVLNGKAGVITDKNKVVVPFIYDETGYEYNSLDMLEVKKDGLYGFVDKKGTVIIPLIYESVNDDFDGGLCLARKKGKWGYLDKTGKTIIPFEYDQALPFYSEKAEVKKGNAWYEIDKSGKILAELPGKK